MVTKLPQNWIFFTIFDLVVTLTSDPLTAKTNQFNFVPKCTCINSVNLLKFPQAVYETSNVTSVIEVRSASARLFAGTWRPLC